jgi:DNA repair exonuclease SbcCD nuclease subunit
MKTLVITDLHLSDKIRGLLNAQTACLSKIFKAEKPDEIVIMGDVFMSRRPSPTVLLGLKGLLDRHQAECPFTILRGNHDSETKADDGVTALSVFDSPTVDIITHTDTNHLLKRVYIPHYENEQHIIEALRGVPKGYRVFGHFGFSGSLNSAGDCDFTIPLREFRNSCMLGHIHHFHERSLDLEEEKITLTCLGTPYTTNFNESGKGNFYAIIEDDEVTYKEVTHGPKHIVVNYDDIADAAEDLNNTDYFKMVQVHANKLSDTENHLIAQDLLGMYPIDCVEVKYRPIFDGEIENYYDPATSLFDLTRDVLEAYVDNSAVELDKDQLMKGLDQINENKESHN